MRFSAPTGDGLRSTSEFQGTTNHYVWNSGTNGQMLADSNLDFIFNGGPAPIMQIGTSSTTPTDLLIQDQNCNMRAIVQISGGTSSYNGQLINYVDYDAFGNPDTQNTGSSIPGGLSVASGGYSYSVTDFGFGSGTQDHSNLTLLVNRYLDDSTGGFLSSDPAVEITKQPYMYARDNPILNIDPSGLWTEGWCVQGQGAALIALQGAVSACFQEANGNQEVGWSFTYTNRILGGLSFKNIFSKKLLKVLSGLNLMKRLIKSFSVGASLAGFVGYSISNCNYIVRCLSGEFTDTSVSIGVGLAGTIDYFDTGHQTKGLFTGIGYGEGFSVGQTQSNTICGLFTGSMRSYAQSALTYLNTGGDYGWGGTTAAIWAMRSVERAFLS